MAFNSALRSRISLIVSSESPLSKSVSRGIHATGAKRMCAHAHDEPYYVRTKHMYTSS